jgi:hypothetical protein
MAPAPSSIVAKSWGTEFKAKDCKFGQQG